MVTTLTFYGESYSASYAEQITVDAKTLRTLFNDHAYYWRATIEHEFELDIVWQDEASEAKNQPPGTVSEMVIYHQQRQFFVRVHQYVLPGSETDQWGRPLLGGTGREPDPKDLIFEDEIWYRAAEPRNIPKAIRRRKWVEE